MNEKKVAFITCVNDKWEYAECLYYLEHLKLPDGWEKDIITIYEADSMAAGYNAGMKNSDAKYKVYLHQDVFIVNQDFITDMCKVFMADNEIGLLGCIGTRNLGEFARAIVSWDTGKIIHNCNPQFLEFPTKEPLYQEVQAVDGLLIATQYDIPWREDVFDGWDYYDISQCMEFCRIGKRVVVPVQKEPWCCHDNRYSKMSKYYHYCNKFVEEYQDIYEFKTAEVSQRIKEYENLREQSRKEILKLIDEGERAELRKIFIQPENRGYLHLREMQLVTDIDMLEEQEHTAKRIWEEGMSAGEVINCLRELEHLIRRIHFQTECEETHLHLQKFSKVARKIVGDKSFLFA